MPVTKLAELARTLPLNWRMARSYRLPSGTLGEPYHIRWNPESPPRGEGWCEARFDASGVIMGYIPYAIHIIAQFALWQYERMLNGHAEARETFFAQAKYLRDAQDTHGKYLVPYAVPAYGADFGCLSAMEQGEAASVLFRAYAQTNDATYLEAGKRALLPLGQDVCDGGAAFIRGDTVFFEEVATDEPCHILNGHLYAAFATWEACAYGFADDGLRRLNERAVATLERSIHLWAVEGWSTYDLACDHSGSRHYAPLHYHQFHIAQLNVYAAMTGRVIFKQWADRWESALNNWRVRRAVWAYGGNLIRRRIMATGRRAGSIWRVALAPM